jgi:hypothetical protein
MTEIDRIWRLLRLDNLEALLVLREIERVGLNFQIDSPQVTPEKKAAALIRRDKVLIEWGETLTELEDLRNSNNPTD